MNDAMKNKKVQERLTEQVHNNVAVKNYVGNKKIINGWFA
jgi:hypothetical protein